MTCQEVPQEDSNAIYNALNLEINMHRSRRGSRIVMEDEDQGETSDAAEFQLAAYALRDSIEGRPSFADPIRFLSL